MSEIICPDCNSKNYTTPGINTVRLCDNNHRYKVCPFCKTVFNYSNFDCPKCKEWIPNLPTSWARSATSLFLLRKVAEYINLYLKNSSDSPSLAKVLASTGVITVNPKKVTEKGNKYWIGTVQRRAAEYTTNLKYLGFLDRSGKKDKLTSLGKEFVKAKTKLDFDSIAIAAMLTLKITNKFDTKETYSAHNIRPIFLSLKLLQEIDLNGGKTSIEHIALAFMCRDEEKDFLKAKTLSLKHSSEYINKLFFSEGRELKRAIMGVFTHWMEEVGLIEMGASSKKTRELTLTKLGSSIVEGFEDKTNKWDLMDSLELIPIFEELVETKSKKKKLLLAKISRERKAGAKWESIVLKSLKKIGYGAEEYSKKRTFAKIKLPTKILNSLPGGTLHNPDIIILKPLILVDAKKDATKEMHKVQAYDGYALHMKINGNAVIFSQTILGEELARRLNELKRTSVVDKNALEVISKNPKLLGTKEVSEIIGVGRNYGQYINEDFVFDYLESK